MGAEMKNKELKMGLTESAPVVLHSQICKLCWNRVGVLQMQQTRG